MVEGLMKGTSLYKKLGLTIDLKGGMKSMKQKFSLNAEVSIIFL